MSENIKNVDIILDKKIENYDYRAHNFIATGEITVTITLSEYRELVKSAATAETRIEKIRNKNNDLVQENTSLKNSLNLLRSAKQNDPPKEDDDNV